MELHELISAIKAKDKRAYHGYRGIETPPEAILAVVNDAIDAQRERSAQLIENLYPSVEEDHRTFEIRLIRADGAALIRGSR